MKRVLYFGGLIILILVIFFGVTAYAQQRLQQLIAKANTEGNSLEVGEQRISFNMLSFAIELDSVTLDQEIADHHVKGQIGQIRVGGLKLFPLLLRKHIRVKEVFVEGPEVEVWPVESTPDSLEVKRKDLDIKLQNMAVRNGRVRRYSPENELVMDVLGLQLDGTALKLPLAPAAAPPLHLRMDSISFPQQGEADWSLNNLAVDVPGKSLTVAVVRLSPRQTARQQLTTQEFKDDWLALRLDTIRFTDLPMDSLWTGEKAVIPSATIGDLNLSIFENPALVQNPARTYKSFPLESFRKLKPPLLLEKLRIQRVNLRYGVLKEGSDAPDLTFDKGTILLENWSTFATKDSTIAHFECALEESAPLSVRFAFAPDGGGRNFTATGNLQNYDLAKSNPLLEVAADAFIESGQIHRMQHRFSFDGTKSTGDLLLRYDKLEVKLTGKGAWFKNIFEDIAIRDGNPRPNGDLVIGTVYHEHEASRSFFNLYWKAVVSGMQSSVAGKVFTPKELNAQRAF